MTDRAARILFAAALAVLLVAAAGLRVWRLDLMPFRFDATAELERARDTLRLGGIPATGIVNSRDFRNPAGFTFLLLPTALATPDPRPSALWLGLLTLSGVVPIVFAGLRLGFATPVAFLAAAAYAFLPWNVFGGRSIWPQNVLPGFAAWALWLLLVALDAGTTPRRRTLAATASIALIGFASLVHLSALAPLAVALGFLIHGIARGGVPRSALAGVAGALALVAAGLIPSYLDRAARAGRPPTEKPPHIEKFEGLMNEAPPLASRLSSAVGGVFEQLSGFGATGGIDEVMPPWSAGAGRAADFVLLGLALVGVTLAAVSLGKSAKGSTANQASLAVILGWTFVPPVAGAIGLERVNATYFVCAIPGTLLLAAFALERLRLQRAAIPVALAVALCHGAFSVEALRTVDRERRINGQYYIPLADQLEVARRLRGGGVGPDNFHHLSGDWFGRPYKYLLRECTGPGRDPVGSRVGFIEDIPLRARHKARADLVASRAEDRVGAVAILFFDDSAAASSFAAEFAALPAD